MTNMRVSDLCAARQALEMVVQSNTWKWADWQSQLGHGRQGASIHDKQNSASIRSQAHNNYCTLSTLRALVNCT